MQPIIQTISEKKLVGKKIELSLSDYKIGELWKSFMPLRNQISNPVSSDLFSVAIYPTNYFSAFNPTNKFQRWATVEVNDFEDMPVGMERFILVGGLYAVFHYTGSNTNNEVFRYIFETWLPNSNYILDNRPHFEILGSKYKNNDPASEEEIWIPVKPNL